MASNRQLEKVNVLVVVSTASQIGAPAPVAIRMAAITARSVVPTNEATSAARSTSRMGEAATCAAVYRPTRNGKVRSGHHETTSVASRKAHGVLATDLIQINVRIDDGLASLLCVCIGRADVRVVNP